MLGRDDDLEVLMPHRDSSLVAQRPDRGPNRDGRRFSSQPFPGTAVRYGPEVHGRITIMYAGQAILRARRENPETRIDRIEIYGADGKLVFETKLPGEGK